MIKSRAVLGLGFGVAVLAAGCSKHETSAPHTTVTVTLRGQGTQAIDASNFEDGWAVRYDEFRVNAWFGLDEAVDHRKPDMGAPLAGAEAYVYGDGVLDLAIEESVPTFGGWVLAGRSSGWGMRLRNYDSSTLQVSGDAVGPQGEALRFDWRFTTAMTFSHCVPSGELSLQLPEEGELNVEAALDGTALFGERVGPEPRLRFEPLARADRDADGTITTAELRATPLSEVDQTGDRYQAPGAATLHDFLTAQLTRLVTLEYACEVSVDACQDRLQGACDDTDLAEKDFDQDGTKNCLDGDVDGDGLENHEDCDPYHSLESLQLCDGSDQHEKDLDRDGTRNCEDPDIDGDGFQNERDGRPYRSPYELPGDPDKAE